MLSSPLVSHNTYTFNDPTYFSNFAFKILDMSSTDESELKGGHPPAVKAGGMRITQSKPPQEKPVEPVPVDQEEEEEELAKTENPPKQQILISGAPARGDADFPTAAVQAIHNKPTPSHEYRASSKPTVIHQPRK